MRPPGIAFDVGSGGEPALAGVDRFFLSHGHLDHALGLPFVLSYRARHGSGDTRVYCPEEIAAAVERLVRSAEALEGASYDFELVGLRPGERVELGREWALDTFPTRHGVPSLGYHVVRRVRRLDPELRDLPRDRIAELTRAGRQVGVVEEEDWLTYCGDCSAETLDDEPRALASRRLVLECTFLAPEARAKARRFGHVHVQDLVERRHAFRNEAIVLSHLSHKHDWRDLRRIVDRELGELAERVRVMG